MKNRVYLGIYVPTYVIIKCDRVVRDFEREAKFRCVTFNFDKQDVIDFTKISKMTVQGLRTRFIKVVIDLLFFGQKLRKFNHQIKFRKYQFLVISIPQNGPDLAIIFTMLLTHFY